LSHGSRSLPRAFLAAAIVLAVATAAGLAILWPGDVEPKLGEGIAAKSERAEVQRIEVSRCSGFGTSRCRDVTVRLETGPDEGRTSVIQLGTGGLDPDLDVGDEVRVVKGAALPDASGGERSLYTLSDFERRRPMLLLVLAFAALVLLFARLRGALSLLGLAFSLAIVLLFVVPSILDGEPPLAVAVVGSMAIMLITITLAHGGGPKSLAAILGTGASLLLTALLAVAFTELTHLTGLSSEEAAILQLNQGNVSLEGLLLAGMVIGALGVLDDVTISQSSTVLALRAANPSLRFGALFGTAMRVGRDHVTATVNTLVLAYVGASLPILLIFSSGQLDFLEVVNLELVAKEVVATLVGSIGLICAVPITTALASLLALREPAERLAGHEPAHVH
jgi:uncharacterized membrane protein